MGQGDAMTAVVLYSSILASAIMALLVWKSNQEQAVLFPLGPIAWGWSPSAETAGHPVQSRFSLSGENPFGTYIYNCNSL